jgi:hypothetical protein
VKEPKQSFDPAGKHQQRDPKSTPRIGKRSAYLRKLGGVVLMDMVEALKSWKEEIPRRNRGGIIVSRTWGDDRNQISTRDLEFRQERKRLGNRNPRNRRR